MNDHLAPEVLAGHAESLLKPGDAAATDAHLAGCGECRRRYADLSSLRSLLAADDPGPMPADVTARLDAALMSARASATTVDLRVERARRVRGRRWLQVGTVAAGLAVVGAGAVFGVRYLADGGPAGGHEAVSGAAAPESGPTRASGPTGPPITASGRTYTAEDLAAQVGQLIPRTVPGAEGLSAPGTAGDRSADGGARPPDSTGLTRCLAALGEAPAAPLAADTGRWTGRPALVLVLPGPDALRVTVYVVEPTCTAGKAEVRHHAVLPLP